MTSERPRPSRGPRERSRVATSGGRRASRARVVVLATLLLTALGGLALVQDALDGRPGEVPPELTPLEDSAEVAAPHAALELPRDEALVASVAPAETPPFADEPDLDAPLEPGEEGAVLVGRVTDVFEHPLTDARVLLVPQDVVEGRPGADDDAPASVAATDEHGAYRLRLLRRGAPSWALGANVPALLLAVEAEGHGVAWRPVEWSGERETFVDDLRLEPEVVLRGRVVDGLGVPLAGVGVRPRVPDESEASADAFVAEIADAPPSFERWLTARRASRTDAHGFFALHGLGPGAVVPELSAEDALSLRRAAVELPRDLFEFDAGDLVFALDRVLAGFVVDEEGRPLADALVAFLGTVPRVSDDGTPHGELLSLAAREPGLCVRTDENGAFRVAGLFRPVYRVCAGAAGRVTSCVERAVPGEPPLRLVLVPSAAERVRVIDGKTLALSEAELELETLPRLRPLLASRGATPPRLEREEPGLFRLSDVDASDVLLHASAPGHVPSEAYIAELPRDPRDGVRLLTLSDACFLSGTLSDGTSGAPVRGARVTVDEHETRSDGAGRYVLDDLPSGAWRVRVRARGYVAWDCGDECPETKAVGQARTLDAVLVRAGRLTGVVRMAGGAPLAGARVGVGPVDAEPLAPVAWVRSGPDGRFALDDVAPGAQRLGAWSPRDELVELAETFVDVRPWETTEAELVAPEPAWVEGLVTRLGARVPDARLRLVDVLGTHASARADDEGAFGFSTSARGRLALEASADGATTSVELDLAPGVRVRAELRMPAGAFAGRVRDAEGRPVAGAEASAWREGGPDWRVTARSETGPDGTFTIEGLASGTYLLAARHPRYADTWIEHLDVEPDALSGGHELTLQRRPAPGRVRVSTFVVGDDGTQDGQRVFDGLWLALIPSTGTRDGIWISDREIAELRPRYATTRDAGCVFDDVPPGRWRLYGAVRGVDGRRRWDRGPRVTVESGATVVVEMQVSSGG